MPPDAPASLFETPTAPATAPVVSPSVGATPPVAPAPVATPPAATPAAPVEVPEWAKDFPEELRTKVAQKGYKTPQDLASAYASAERLIGEKASMFALPKEGDSTARRELLTKLGTPETPDKYAFELPADAKSLVPPERLTAIGKILHEVGIPQHEAAALVSKVVAMDLAQVRAAETEYSTAAKAQQEALFTEWGEQKNARLEAVRRGAERALGLTAAEMPAIERALGGPKRAAEVFLRIGQPLMEADFKSGSGSSSFTPTPAEAVARINEIHADRVLSKRFADADPDLRKEVATLQRIISGVANPA
jgi:hypothetical protein